MNQQQKENQVTAKPVRRDNVQKMRTSSTKTCSICRERFYSASKFTLFCGDCKEHSESYRFADWLSA